MESTQRRLKRQTASLWIKSDFEVKIVEILAMKEASRSGRISRSKRSKTRDGRAAGSARPGTVLVVDDDPSVLRSLNRLISASGFTAKTFARPSDLVASEIPVSNACMVVDIDMPEMTGIEMCEALKTAGRGLPAILITGRTDTRTRLQAAQADVVAVLFKPFDKEPLLEAIARALALSTTKTSGV